jgi:hypothetical protein
MEQQRVAALELAATKVWINKIANHCLTTGPSIQTILGSSIIRKAPPKDCSMMLLTITCSTSSELFFAACRKPIDVLLC